jgi:hypothetical protein
VQGEFPPNSLIVGAPAKLKKKKLRSPHHSESEGS